MANRNPLPNPDDKLEAIAEDLLGVDFPDDSLDEPVDVEVAGLSLEELGFGAPPEPEPQLSQPEKSEPEKKGEGRDADILSLVARAKQFEKTEAAEQSPAEAVPATKPVRSLLEEISGDEFGAGLLDDQAAQERSEQGDAAQAVDTGEECEEFEGEDEDQFGADLDDDEIDEIDEIDVDEVEELDASEEEEPVAASAEEEDTYWDALEGWEWNDEGTESRRGPKSHEPGSQGRSQRPGRRRPERSGGSTEKDSGRRGERPGAKPRRRHEEVSEPAPAARRRPATKPEEVTDEFGAGLLEQDTRSAAEAPEPEEKGDGKKSRRRRRRRKGRPEGAPPPVAETLADTDEFGELDEDEALETSQAFEDEGDEFGAGLGLEAPAKRRPPRQDRAAKPKVEPAKPEQKRRPERTAPSETRRTPVRERQPAEETSELDKDRYKGIPTWEEAINLLARKVPTTRSGGDDRRGRSRGRRGGGRSRRG